MVIDEDAFDGNVYEDCTVYVPSGTRWEYRHHKYWGKYKGIEIEKK